VCGLPKVNWFDSVVKVNCADRLRLPGFSTIGLCSNRGEVGAIAAAEGGGDNIIDVRDFRDEKGASQGQNLALAVLCVPSALDRGWRERRVLL